MIDVPLLSKERQEFTKRSVNFKRGLPEAFVKLAQMTIINVKPTFDFDNIFSFLVWSGIYTF